MTAEPSARLFVALWPEPRVRVALAAHAAQWAWPARSARVGPERLHLTLHFLGGVARARLSAIGRALALASPRFTLTLSVPQLWPGGIAVLAPAHVPPPLAELHVALGGVLRDLDLPAQVRDFRPHVTLARRASGATAPSRDLALDWPVAGYALVESRQPGGYAVLRRYPAVAAPTLERGRSSTGGDG